MGAVASDQLMPAGFLRKVDAEGGKGAAAAPLAWPLGRYQAGSTGTSVHEVLLLPPLTRLSGTLPF